MKMAEAKSTTIEKPVTKVEKQTGYTLTLTKAEAEALGALLGSVSGSTEDTPRKHTDAAYWALAKAGVDTSKEAKRLSGSLRWTAVPRTPYRAY
jgi:hypothetical protein